MYEYKAKVLRVIDGDTIVTQIQLGFSITIEQHLRLARIDAYEKTLRGQTQEEKNIGLEATDYLTNLLLNKDIIVRTFKESGKYGRYIAEVIYDDSNISDQMVKLGYANYENY